MSKDLKEALLFIIAVIVVSFAMVHNSESRKITPEKALYEKLSDMTATEATEYMSEVYGIKFWNSEDREKLISDCLDILTEDMTAAEMADYMSDIYGEQFFCPSAE